MQNGSIATGLVEFTYAVELLRNSMYFMYGCLWVLWSATLLVTLLRYRALRSRPHHLMQLPILINFLVSGGGYIAAAVERLPRTVDRSIFTGQMNVQDCLGRLSLWLWQGTNDTCVMTLLALALDRLYLVLFPTHYLRRRLPYAAMVAVAPLIYYVISYIVGTADRLYTYNCIERYVSPACYLDEVYTYYDYCTLVMCMCVVAVALSLHFVLTLKLLGTTNADIDDAAWLRRQKGVSVTFALYAALYLLFILLPCTFVFFIDYRSRLNAILLGGIQMLLTLQFPICYLLLFVKRHRELRIGVMALARRKHMPDTFRLWT